MRHLLKILQLVNTGNETWTRFCWIPKMMMYYALPCAGPCLGIQCPSRNSSHTEAIVLNWLPFRWRCQRKTAGLRASKNLAIRNGKKARRRSTCLAQEGWENRAPEAVHVPWPSPSILYPQSFTPAFCPPPNSRLWPCPILVQNQRLWASVQTRSPVPELKCPQAQVGLWLSETAGKGPQETD